MELVSDDGQDERLAHAWKMNVLSRDGAILPFNGDRIEPLYLACKGDQSFIKSESQLCSIDWQAGISESVRVVVDASCRSGRESEGGRL